MKGWMKWLLVPVGLSLVLAFSWVQPASARCYVTHYGVALPSYHTRRVYYRAPVVRYYRPAVVVPRAAYYFPHRAYYRAYYGFRPLGYCPVW